MSKYAPIIIVISFIMIRVTDAMAIEQAKYQVIQKEGRLEVRDYESHILAETIAEGDLESAGNEGFQKLLGYISGKNRSRTEISMTAPVSQSARGAKIEMTAPVGQRPADDKWVISFMMPAQYSLKALPLPDDPQVKLREIPPRRMAALRYSGRWTEESYLKHKKALMSWVKEKGFVAIGDPIWARYNPPFMPWFLRRNEILIPIVDDGSIG